MKSYSQTKEKVKKFHYDNQCYVHNQAQCHQKMADTSVNTTHRTVIEHIDHKFFYRNSEYSVTKFTNWLKLLVHDTKQLNLLYKK